MSRHTTPLLIPLLLALIHTSVVSSTACYAPDGSVNSDPSYIPCSNDTSDPLHTICCALNRSLPDGIPDICAPNGLCLQGRNESKPAEDPKWTKPQCTNANWDDPGCLHVCGDENVGWITPCEKSAGNASTKWCCGFEKTDCCNDGAHLEQEIIPVNFDPNNGTISTTSTASVPSSTLAPTTTAPSSSSTNPASQSGGMSTGAKAGIGVGASLGGLLLLALGIYLGKYLHAKKSKAADTRPQEMYSEGSHGLVTYAHHGSNYGGATPDAELPNYKTRQEQEEIRAVNVELASHREPTELP